MHCSPQSVCEGEQVFFGEKMKNRRNSQKVVTKPTRSTLIAGQPTQDGQTPIDEGFDTLIAGMPSLASLFEKLGSQEHPDFMSVWLAISEMVAFYTEPRLVSGDGQNAGGNRSEKKCRFCS